ncbi:hypothetical protein ACCO45_008680 [Purpureocillium lilacinum]|uniref:Uncharacterized protein n=1 Tax=Purpureocillium lilacinum TaxID=33203 RepID=A0ACC4DNZ5_PURLI
MAAPIRVAIIGLSASAITSWASTAHLPYLLSPRGRTRYTIVALCNSSVDAARAAIRAFDLPPSPPPARGEGGKGRTLVGMQGRVAPPVVKLQQLIGEGRIGKVLSSEVRAFGGSHDRERLAVGLKCFTELDIGGNIVTIGFGHLFDQIQHVLGDIQGLQSRLQLQRPDVVLIDPSTTKAVETTRSDVPDLVIATGTLPATATTQQGANIVISYRRGQPFPNSPGLVWTINGEKGEVRLTAMGGPTLQSSAYTKPVTIEVHDFASDSVESVPWEWDAWQEELPIPGRNIARLYENFAEGKDNATTPSAEDALKRHVQLGEILEAWTPPH